MSKPGALLPASWTYLQVNLARGAAAAAAPHRGRVICQLVSATWRVESLMHWQ
jgi:hypothetical protein